jgi:hypothetical protein
MKLQRYCWIALVLLSVVLMIVSCTPVGNEPGGGEGDDDEATPITIPDLKGENREKYVGQEVTVEGIFVNDPVPMLVTKLDFVLMNMPIPETEYVLLDPKQAEEIDAAELGGANMKLKGIVEIFEQQGIVEQIIISQFRFEVVDMPLDIYNPRIQDIRITLMDYLREDRFAVLFSGGINANKNYVRYWNDLKFMYSTLVNTLGFLPENILVLYADGTGRDNDMPVDYSATETNLDTAFDAIRNASDSTDLIFFFTTNHGSGFYSAQSQPHWYGGQLDTDNDEQGDSINENNYNLDFNSDGDTIDVISWDEALNAWGAQILDDEFHTILDNIHFDTMIIVMEQCFSGGMILDMSQGGNRIIISAAGEYEPSWAMTGGNYDEFSYYFTSAINHADPNGTAVNADSDGDGVVSLVEAFNYAINQDSKSETPQYEDNGDGVPSSGTMPSGTEGGLGGGFTLDP